MSLNDYLNTTDNIICCLINTVLDGGIADNSTSTNYAQKVIFSNPTVLTGTTTFRLTVSVPFASSSSPQFSWPQSPAWPILQILFPVAEVRPYATMILPNCSTQSQPATSPGPVRNFATTITPNTLANYVIQWINRYRNLNFNLSDPLGVAADAVYGRPLIGTQFIVSSVALSFDGTTLIYTFQADLNQLVSACSAYGASLVVNPNNRVYYIPISYEERLPNGVFTQFTILYTVVISTSGVATISTNTNYREISFPLTVTFPTTGCSSNSAQMRILWQLELRDVFDSSRIIGPRSLNDVSIRSPALPPGPNNCFGDQIVDFQIVGCNYLQASR